MITIKKNCYIKGKDYKKGDEYIPNKEDKTLLIKLNEKGYIEPLTQVELSEFLDSFSLKKKSKKQEIGG